MHFNVSISNMCQWEESGIFFFPFCSLGKRWRTKGIYIYTQNEGINHPNLLKFCSHPEPESGPHLWFLLCVSLWVFFHNIRLLLVETGSKLFALWDIIVKTRVTNRNRDGKNHHVQQMFALTILECYRSQKAVYSMFLNFYLS